MNEPFAESNLRPLRLLLLLFALIAGLRIGAQSDLHEGDQPKQADYVLDIVCNGNWTVQHHADGSIMSKPPLYNWIAAPAVMLFGAEDVWLKLPSLLAGLAAVLMAWDLARRRLGERAAFWGCVFLMLTSMFAKQMYYARTDMMLACFTVMQFWAAIRLEDAADAGERSGWVWRFWIATAFGNLTKGPLALLPLLALAAFWIIERRFNERVFQLGLWWGVPLSLLPLAAWFAMACHLEGPIVYQHLVRGEMLDRFKNVADKVVGDNSNRPFYYYLPQVLGRTLPWSLFGLLGLWGAGTAQHNASLNDRERGMLRFLATWFCVILLFWSLVPSKRVDRIFPAVPPLCLLAGWAFAEFLKSQSQSAEPRVRVASRVDAWSAVLIAAAFILAGIGLLGVSLDLKFGLLTSIRSKISPATLQSISADRTLVPAVCVITAFGGLAALGAFAVRRAKTLACALVVSNLAVIVLYQWVLGTWMQTDFCQGAAPVCREIRKRAKSEGAGIMVLAGSGPAARFYLLQPGLEIPPKDAEARLAQPHGALYVVGTQPFLENNQRRGGALEQAGLVGAMPVIVPEAFRCCKPRRERSRSSGLARILCRRD